MITAYLIAAPFIGAMICFLAGIKNERVRDGLAAAFSVAELAAAIWLFSVYARGSGSWEITGILTGSLSFRADGFRCVYAVITVLMWAGTSLFALEYFKHEREGLNRYWMFVLMTLGATEGVMLSGDLMTAFIFFEILSFTSFTWVIHEQTNEAVRAGYTYLFIAVIGGLVLFMGLQLLMLAAGTLRFDRLREAVLRADPVLLRAAGICILLGFGAKAGMVPVHVWLPKAHPVAPSPASALLSGVLTKVGIYGILMISLHALSGDGIFGGIVLAAGLITMLLGAVLGVFSINLKRTLACSSMSQIGFILTGTGMMILHGSSGSEEGIYTAMSGLMLHMVNHSLIKLTLFMAAGVVVMNLHALTLDEIRGWGRNKPALKTAFALGALGISGVPLMNGYLSKTLLHEGIVEGIHHFPQVSGWLKCAEWVFLFSGGLTFCYMLKLFICLFAEKNADPMKQAEFDRRTAYMNPVSVLAVTGSSLLCPLLGQGFIAKPLAALMTGSDEILHFRPFTAENLKGSAISLTIGAVIYLGVVRTLARKDGHYVNYWPAWADLEERIYRPLMTRILPGIGGAAAGIFGENVILKPLCKAVMIISAAVLRVLEMSTDTLAVLIRATFLREKKNPDRVGRPGLAKVMAAELSQAAGPILSNFTFALMMTCIGIVVILFAIVYTSVL